MFGLHASRKAAVRKPRLGEQIKVFYDDGPDWVVGTVAKVETDCDGKLLEFWCSFEGQVDRSPLTFQNQSESWYEKRHFLSCLYIYERSFYQDRLETNRGKVEKRVAFFAGSTWTRWATWHTTQTKRRASPPPFFHRLGP